MTKNFVKHSAQQDRQFDWQGWEGYLENAISYRLLATLLEMYNNNILF